MVRSNVYPKEYRRFEYIHPYLFRGFQYIDLLESFTVPQKSPVVLIDDDVIVLDEDDNISESVSGQTSTSSAEHTDTSAISKCTPMKAAEESRIQCCDQCKKN